MSTHDIEGARSGTRVSQAVRNREIMQKNRAQLQQPGVYDSLDEFKSVSLNQGGQVNTVFYIIVAYQMSKELSGSPLYSHQNNQPLSRKYQSQSLDNREPPISKY